MTLSIRNQLALAFGTLSILSVLAAVISLRGLTEVNERFDSYVNEHGRLAAMAVEVRGAVNDRAVAARNLLLVTSDADRSAELAKVQESHARVQKSLTALRDLLAADRYASEADRTAVDRISEVEALYGPVALDIVARTVAGDNASATAKLVAECRPLLAQLLDVVGDYVQYSEVQAQSSVAAAESNFASTRLVLTVFCLASVVGAIVLGTLFGASLSRALGAEPAALRGMVRRMADGDLGPITAIETARPGSVLASLGVMQRQLVELIAQVRGTADGIAEASGRIAGDSRDMSTRTTQQAASLQQTTAAMSNLGMKVVENAEDSDRANRLAQEASTVAVNGGEAVEQVVATMQEINEGSRRIADITGVINDISFQTNILALNAAVEAARAGEQGRGFAVVAGEVGSLAQRSSKAAKEIEDLVNESVHRVEHGSAQVTDAVGTISGVVGSIQEVAVLMSNINAASAAQRQGVAEVDGAVRHMEEGTRSNARMVEESAEAADALRLRAQQLVDAVAVFRLDG